MSSVKDKNMAIMQKNKNDLRDIEEFYVNGTVENLLSKLNELKEQKTSEIIAYVNDNQHPILNKYGEVVDYRTIMKPVVINNYFFKSICPLGNKIPVYNAEKLAIVFDYYQFLITQINELAGNFPPSLTGFCKLAGISTNTLREYKNSSDIEMRNVVEKIYDQLGDDNLTMSQLGQVKEKSTIFKLEAQHEIVKKNQPNVNITYKEVINTDRLNSNLEKYKSLINKKAGKE